MCSHCVSRPSTTPISSTVPTGQGQRAARNTASAWPTSLARWPASSSASVGYCRGEGKPHVASGPHLWPSFPGQGDPQSADRSLFILVTQHTSCTVPRLSEVRVEEPPQKSFLLPPGWQKAYHSKHAWATATGHPSAPKCSHPGTSASGCGKPPPSRSMRSVMN